MLFLVPLFPGMNFDDPDNKGTFVASSDVGNVSWIVPTIQPIFHIDAKGPNHSVVRVFTIQSINLFKLCYHFT